MQKVKSLQKRFKTVVCNDTGASTVEWIVFSAVALIIGVALFVFKDRVVDFVNRARDNVVNWTTQI